MCGHVRFGDRIREQKHTSKSRTNQFQIARTSVRAPTRLNPELATREPTQVTNDNKNALLTKKR